MMKMLTNDDINKSSYKDAVQNRETETYFHRCPCHSETRPYLPHLSWQSQRPSCHPEWQTQGPTHKPWPHLCHHSIIWTSSQLNQQHFNGLMSDAVCAQSVKWMSSDNSSACYCMYSVRPTILLLPLCSHTYFTNTLLQRSVAPRTAEAIKLWQSCKNNTTLEI